MYNVHTTFSIRKGIFMIRATRVKTASPTVGVYPSVGLSLCAYNIQVCLSVRCVYQAVMSVEHKLLCQWVKPAQRISLLNEVKLCMIAAMICFDGKSALSRGRVVISKRWSVGLVFGILIITHMGGRMGFGKKNGLPHSFAGRKRNRSWNWNM